MWKMELFSGKSLGRWMRKSKEGVRSEEQFHSRIASERALANRNGHRFSVLTLRPLPMGDRELAGRLASLSREEVRVSDEIGWFDGQRTPARPAMS